MIIKLGPASMAASAVPASPGGMRVVLPALRFGGTSANSSAQNTDALRAVAAAAASVAPGMAKLCAKVAKKEPHTAHGEYEAKANDLKPVLAAVVAARDSRSTVAPTDVGQAVARAVGANPPLVAAAAKALATQAATEGALWWVATLDRGLLARAGEAATRATLLTLPGPASQLDDVKAKVTQLEKDLAEKVSDDTLTDAIKKMGIELDTKIDGQKLSDAVAEAKTELGSKIDDIEKRLVKLEPNPSGGGGGGRRF